MNDRRKNPSDQVGYGWYNHGALIGVEYRRKSAIAAVENHTGQPWTKAKRYMEVHKVRVSRIQPDGQG